MKQTLRILAVLIVLAAAGFWFAAGANRGFSKTSVFIKTVDEVTGIEGTTEQKKFIPGVDFLAAAFGGAVVLAGVSFLFRNRKPNQINNPSTTL
ncbi:MAG: hypothetical protein H7Y43_02340 [Akkermansiaceae bacterium]|nr:hypothetical protein [Verrucomicrobiales bacterium]